MVTVHVRGGVELAHAGDIPIADFTSAAQNHVGHHDRVGDFAGAVAVHRVVPVDEETRIRQADLFDDVAAEQTPLETQGVHHAVAGASECGRSDRIGDAEGNDEIVLPVERAAVIVVSAALDHIMAAGPLGESFDGFGHHGHIVVHHPEPFGSQLVCLLHTCGEAACAAEVVGLRRVHHAAFVARLVGDGIAPLRGDRFTEIVDHALGRLAVLVVHDDDTPWRHSEFFDGFEQGGEQLLTLVRHHDDSQLFDGVLRNLLFSHTFHSCTRPQPNIACVRIMRHDSIRRTGSCTFRAALP